MSDDVKPRRRYDSTRRQAQAARTRQDILAAARDLFLERGYAGTTLAAIAKAAGVVVETLYRAYGSKAELFKAVVRAAVAGGADRATVPVERRPAQDLEQELHQPGEDLRVRADERERQHDQRGDEGDPADNTVRVVLGAMQRRRQPDRAEQEPDGDADAGADQ